MRAGEALTLLEAASTAVTIPEISQLLTGRVIEAKKVTEVLPCPPDCLPVFVQLLLRDE